MNKKIETLEELIEVVGGVVGEILASKELKKTKDELKHFETKFENLFQGLDYCYRNPMKEIQVTHKGRGIRPYSYSSLIRWNDKEKIFEEQLLQCSTWDKFEFPFVENITCFYNIKTNR